MFASPLSSTFYPSNIFSSPLMPRSANASPRKPRQPKPSPPKPAAAPLSPPITPTSDAKPAQSHERAPQYALRDSRPTLRAVPQRGRRANPFCASPEVQRRERRDGFLRKVAGDREERRWSARGDQILQQDYMAQRRVWEAARARSAPDFDFESDESRAEPLEARLASTQGAERMDVGGSQQAGSDSRASELDARLGDGRSRDQDEVDALLEAEEEELNALVALHEQPPSPDGALAASPRWMSDDDEFDALLMEMEDVAAQTITGSAPEDAMDMSGG